eukprot:UN21620
MPNSMTNINIFHRFVHIIENVIYDIFYTSLDPFSTDSTLTNMCRAS